MEAVRKHVSADGQMRKCTAEVGNCPVKMEDGSPAPHGEFTNDADAQAFAEKAMEAQYGGSFTQGAASAPAKKAANPAATAPRSRAPKWKRSRLENASLMKNWGKNPGVMKYHVQQTLEENAIAFLGKKKSFTGTPEELATAIWGSPAEKIMVQAARAVEKNCSVARNSSGKTTLTLNGDWKKIVTDRQNDRVVDDAILCLVRDNPGATTSQLEEASGASNISERLDRLKSSAVLQSGNFNDWRLDSENERALRSTGLVSVDRAAAWGPSPKTLVITESTRS